MGKVIKVYGLDFSEYSAMAKKYGYKSRSQLFKEAVYYFLLNKKPELLEKEALVKIKRDQENYKIKLEREEKIKAYNDIQFLYNSEKAYTSLMFFPFNQSMEIKKVIVAKTFNKFYVKRKKKLFKDYLSLFPECGEKKVVREMLKKIEKDILRLSLTNENRMIRLGKIMEFYYPEGLNNVPDYLKGDVIK